MNFSLVPPIRPRRLGLYAITFAFLIGLLLVPACRGPGGRPPARPAESGAGTLVVATSGDYPPFSHWPDSAPAPEGFSVDLARAYARSIGAGITWRRFRWPTLLEDLRDERFDLAISGITVRPDRVLEGRFSLPLTTSGALVLVEHDSPIRSAADLDASTVVLAVNAGGHLERVARERLPRARIIAVDANAGVLDRLGREGVIGVVTDTIEAPLWQTRRPGLRAIGPLTRDWKAALFDPRRDAERARFDRWLLEAEASGLLPTLRARHGLPEGATAAPAQALAASLTERLSLMTRIAASKRTLGLPIEDRPREAKVLAAAAEAARMEAERRDLPVPDPARIEAFYRAQIEAAKSIQRAWTAAERGSAKASDEATAAARQMLDGALRPALIALGDRIAALVVASGATPAPRAGLLRETLATHRLPESDLRALEGAFRALFRPGAADAPPPRPQPVERGTTPSG